MTSFVLLFSDVKIFWSFHPNYFKRFTESRGFLYNHCNNLCSLMFKMSTLHSDLFRSASRVWNLCILLKQVHVSINNFVLNIYLQKCYKDCRRKLNSIKEISECILEALMNNFHLFISKIFCLTEPSFHISMVYHFSFVNEILLFMWIPCARYQNWAP